jgi:putative SOS response-associated peptidase YedK
MCGRFTLTTPTPVLAELFLFPDPGPEPPRYNVAPTQAVATVRAGADPGHRELAWCRWGLIPSWADDPAIGNRMINARAETAAEKPAFRSVIRHRRCLILADGFYEWQKRDGAKQPYYFRRKDGRPFAFAGLWDRWQDGDKRIESCTILTTDANDLLRPVHNRMPVILEPEAYERWLDPAVQKVDEVKPFLQPYRAGDMQSYAVSLVVNNPRNDVPKCIEPAA